MRGGGFLRFLDLSYNHIGDRGAQLIADLLKVREEEHFCDSRNLHLSKLDTLQDDVQLEVLNLASNNIGSEGAGAIARALHVNDKLHTLNLGDNPLTDDGGMHFAEMLQVSLGSVLKAKCNRT